MTPESRRATNSPANRSQEARKPRTTVSFDPATRRGLLETVASRVPGIELSIYSTKVPAELAKGIGALSLVYGDNTMNGKSQGYYETLHAGKDEIVVVMQASAIERQQFNEELAAEQATRAAAQHADEDTSS